MKLSVVLVHYHTPQLAERACQALLQDAAASGLELELVLIDNGSQPEDLALLEGLPARRINPGANLGYAGGANLGVRETSADFLVVMNPDVEVLPGCLEALVESLDAGSAAVGPRFYWDHDKRFLLPPTEPVSFAFEACTILARRGGAWASYARRRWRRHARRHWLAGAPLPSHQLSGALLALRRTAWEAIGPFDEAYRLYFEETDWLTRLRRAGQAARFVPNAEAVHLYAQSTISEERAAQWFEASSRRFRRQAYGELSTRMLEGLSRRIEPRVEPEGRQRSSTPSQAHWLEVSPSPLGFPAAGRHFPTGDFAWELPEPIRRRMAPGRYLLSAVDKAGHGIETRVVDISAPSQSQR
ncbi:MAG: glycosyltransferase family 2 protein [Acidobacteriota bacterium]